MCVCMTCCQRPKHCANSDNIEKTNPLLCATYTLQCRHETDLDVSSHKKSFINRKDLRGGGEGMDDDE